ncbi:predicted protein [Nematostella vectensis]|uniref:DNA-directed RNA polymerase I subunit RPA49 n=1 Tax=Nematostella vectensis TaxID=45351 RepID=A7SSI8_NEMVE|nr:DNA-directed RNA polymerase I subunit RPA49 [Nematostella vectensis]EDO33328.1 predicted protein [Nematostella vectensis]|eukprot:XP_001625428.1 predicted protein [Nematostella vectensis]
MATARLTYVPLEEDGLQPILVQFTNGCLTADKKGKRKDGLKFSYYRWADKADRRKKQRRTLVAKSEKMEYNGQNFGQFSRASSLCKYLVGVHDTSTGDMNVYDAQMFTLQPKILETAAATEQEDSKKDMSYLEKNDRLTEAFGSNKKKRAMVSRQKNMIEEDVLDTTVVNAVKGSLNASFTEMEEPEQSSSIPPYNQNALEPSDVYRLDNIITPPEYETIRGPAKELEASKRDTIDEWRQQSRFPEYILHHAAVMPMDPEQRAHKSCLLLYLSYMITLYHLNYKAINKKDVLSNVPDMIKNKLLRMFTLENPQRRGNRLVPKRLKDRLLSYILVLALIIDDFIVDCNSIGKSLKMDPKKVANHMRVLGCSVDSAGTGRKRKVDGETAAADTRTASLVTPLPPNFPNI